MIVFEIPNHYTLQVGLSILLSSRNMKSIMVSRWLAQWCGRPYLLRFLPLPPEIFH